MSSVLTVFVFSSDIVSLESVSTYASSVSTYLFMSSEVTADGESSATILDLTNEG